jgi:hypothetical protein
MRRGLDAASEWQCTIAQVLCKGPAFHNLRMRIDDTRWIPKNLKGNGPIEESNEAGEL